MKARNIFRFTPIYVQDRVEDGGQIARIGVQLLVEGDIAAHPDPETNGIDNEKQEDCNVWQGEGDRPDIVGTMHSAEPSLSPGTWRRQATSDRKCLLCYAHDRLAWIRS